MSWANAGQEALVEQFRQVARRRRLAHAYLFVGPAGVGKRRFAIELAKSLLCQETEPGMVGEPCDRCPDCLQVDARTHPDFQQLSLPDDKLEFPMELMLEAVRHVGFKPARGRYRVMIIDDADSLNEESANAFLKTLEEPPPASLLILLATNENRQLPTVRSRCQIIRFPPLPEKMLAQRLVAEGLVSDESSARDLARRSRGSLEAARELADPEMAEARRALLDRFSQARIDSVGIAGNLVKFVEAAGKDGAPRRQRAARMLGFLAEFLAAALRVQQGGDPVLTDPHEAAQARRLAETIPAEQLLAALDRCLEADYQVERRLQLVLVLEAAIDAIGQNLQAG